MNSLFCIIGLVLLMYVVLKIYFMLQNKAPLVEKFLEAPFAKFRKGNYDRDESILDDDGDEIGMINIKDYNLPMNYEIKKLLSNYLKSNENCEIGRSDLYYKVFVTSLRNFIRYNFLKTLGYVPDNDTLDVTDTREYRIYKKILQNIPDCYNLMKNFLKIDINELDVQHGGHRVGKHSRSVKKLGMYSGDEYATYGKEDGTSKKKDRKHRRLPAEKPLVEDNSNETVDNEDNNVGSKPVDTDNNSTSYLDQFKKIFSGNPQDGRTRHIPELSQLTEATPQKPDKKEPQPNPDDSVLGDERSDLLYKLARGN